MPAGGIAPWLATVDFKRFNNRWSAVPWPLTEGPVLKGHMNLPQPLNAADLQHVANVNYRLG